MPPALSDASAPKASAQGVSRSVPDRFIVSRGTLRWDRFMNSAIVFGGIGIIVAVFGIFAFILLEILPLFRQAKIEPRMDVALRAPAGALAGLDEWSELPFYFDGGSEVVFQPAAGGAPVRAPTGLPPDIQITARHYDALAKRIVIGTADGRIGYLTLQYQPVYDAAGRRTIAPSITAEPLQPLLEAGAGAGPLTAVAFADAGDRKLFGAIEMRDGRPTIVAMTLKQKKTLMGKGKVGVDRRDDLTGLLQGAEPVRVLAPGTANSLIAVTKSGEVLYLFLGSGGWEMRQRFMPFPGGVKGIEFLFGDVSLVAYNEQGKVRIYSLFVPDGGQARVFGLTKEFEPIAGAIEYYQASQRNKSFLVGNAREAALCYATTAAVRRDMKLPFEAVSAAMDAKAEHIGLVDKAGTMHLYSVDDPHPEAGWRAFFGKVWYEGFAAPKYEWQSTGGTDDFEPKLSLVPLIAGSFKGTLYALIFAVPIALLAAIYTSQFLSPRMKRVVKPAMEIMASLPSVVLGFLAALWLAPAIETKVPSVLLGILAIPISAIVLGWVWGRVPMTVRNRLPKGSEYLLIAPLMIGLMILGWHLGPALERGLFTVDMADGSRVADFRLWWPKVTGLPYDQRNCLVVGFMMGFAVIPVIFTIAEDALSNVPPALTSASEALGASRWQVVRTVVLPVASAGIFSALMIGFGRAVGETMIMVMATGNTPIFDPNGHFVFGEHWNIFNGMRTLSANIAVELPEAVEGSTHYRTLFLGALLLFLMTFVMNTAAEMLRQKLRDKFKIV